MTVAPTVTTMPFSRALNAGLRAALAGSDRVLLMGEDIGPLGGVFRVTEGLQAEFGDRRVLDTPLAESGIVGTAIGLAMAGFRPVCEIQFDGFVFPAFDQITTQLAKQTYRHEGALQLPVVIRIPYGGHIGAVEHHQESPEAYFTHTPGLRVVSPSTPNDAYWMIQDAIASPDPVIFLEPKAKYWQKGEVDTSARALPLHASRVVAPRHRRHARRTRRDGLGAPAGGGDRGIRGHELRGRRCAIAVARRLRPDPRLGARAPAGWSTRRRPPGSRASAPRSPRPSWSARSMRSKLRSFACRASTRRSLRPSSKARTCPTPTASSRPSTDPSHLLIVHRVARRTGAKGPG